MNSILNGTFIVLLLSLFVSYQLSIINVPANFDTKFNLKFFYLIGKAFGNLSKFLAACGIGTEINNLRYLDGLNKHPLFNGTKKIETKIENVNVRIYSKINESEMVPIIIWFHSGAYAVGGANGLNHNDFTLSRLAISSNSKVILPDYKLAPEFPYPQPINDCYDVAKYVLENPLEFNGNPDQIILAGESAGGNAVAVITQRLLKEKRKLPKLQILIYPWLQMVDYRLPSAKKYRDIDLISLISNLEKFVLWYLGINQVDNDLEYFLTTNSHFSFIDNDLKTKISSILNPDLIPEEYKKGKDYYNSNSESIDAEYSIPSRFKNNDTLKKILMKAFQPDISPILADLSDLKGLPRALIMACEWDRLKDEALIYSERLKQSGVDTKIELYENGLHGMLIFPFNGFGTYEIMFKDILTFINSYI